MVSKLIVSCGSWWPSLSVYRLVNISFCHFVRHVSLHFLRYVVTRTRSEYSGRSSSKYKKAMNVDTQSSQIIKKALNEFSDKNKSKSKSLTRFKQ